MKDLDPIKYGTLFFVCHFVLIKNWVSYRLLKICVMEVRIDDLCDIFVGNVNKICEKCGIIHYGND